MHLSVWTRSLQQQIVKKRPRVYHVRRSLHKMPEHKLDVCTAESRRPKLLVNAEIQQQLGAPPKMRENPAFKKIDTPEFRGLFTPELQALIEIFSKYKHELRIAGGAVRDLLMDIKPKDIDLATTATPDEMKKMFEVEQVRLINAKGERHGTITPRIHNKENFEVTTLRIDVRTDGRHADVQFTTNWQLDANRRDLTINSMFLGFDGTLYDYFYGYNDLLERRVVFVGEPDKRIKEDYLRILRYFRFYGRIARKPAEHDATILASIRHNIDGLERISGERIWSEVQKIVVGNYAAELMEEMIKCGIAKYCGLPKEPNVVEFKRLCADLVDFPKPHLPILFMIALLNTHEDAMGLHQRLKLSANERDLALFITQQREKVDKDYNTLRDYQELCFQPSARRDYVEQLLKYCNKRELYDELTVWLSPKFPLNGNLLKQHGVEGTKRMGVVLWELKHIWIRSDYTLTAEHLLQEHLPQVLANLSPDSPPKRDKTTTKRMRKSDL